MSLVVIVVGLRFQDFGLMTDDGQTAKDLSLIYLRVFFV